MTVRERIKQALIRAGKTQGDLADYLKVKQSSVSGVLSRDTEFDSIKYLEATEKITGYKFEYLRTGEGPQLDAHYLDTWGMKINPQSPKEAEAERDILYNTLATKDQEIARLRIEIDTLKVALRELGVGLSQRQKS